MNDAETSWQARAEIALLAALKTAQPISYDALAKAADVPSPHRIHKLTLWLEHTMAEDVAADRPMRATIVVSRLNNRPARGFFETAQRLGVLAAELPAEQQIDWFHTQQIAACTAFG